MEYPDLPSGEQHDDGSLGLCSAGQVAQLADSSGLLSDGVVSTDDELFSTDCNVHRP